MSNNSFSLRASAHLHLGQFSLAFSDCDTAAQLEPASSKAYNRMGFALQALGHLQAARDAHAIVCQCINTQYRGLFS